MIVGEKYEASKVDTHYDAIVIGSGLGGMTTAALLAKAGQKVLVLERHYTAGGFTHSFRRRSYEWDVGVHYIGEVGDNGHLVRRIFDTVTDSKLQWARMADPYDKMIVGDEQYDFVSGGAQAQKHEFLKSFPGAEKQIDEYYRHVKAATRSAKVLIAEKQFPSTLRSLVATGARTVGMDYFGRTTKDVLDGITTDPKLAGVLTGQWGDYGVVPSRSAFGMHALLANHYFDGAYYPVGGASQIARTIEPVITRAGGAMMHSAEVEQILVRGNRACGVRLNNGDEITAERVISDTGIRNTFGRLLPEEVGNRHPLPASLAKIEPSMSNVSLFLGIKGSASELGLHPGNRWVYGDYDHDVNLSRCVDGLPGENFPVKFLSFPSAKDPKWDEHYPGRSTIDVIGFTPFTWFERWKDVPWDKRGAEYDDFKAQMAERLLDEVYRQAPQVRGRIESQELATPLATVHFANYPTGEIYGLEHTPERFAHSWLKPTTPIKGLYLTGQDVATGGVAGSLAGGAIAAARILGPAAVKIMPSLVVPGQRWIADLASSVPLARSRARTPQATEKLAPPPPPMRSFQARCVEVLDVTADTRAFRFAVDGGQPLEYLPGQFVTLEIDVEGAQLFRSYTMSSSPTGGELFEITVKRVDEGPVSNALCDNLSVGDVLAMSGPHGSFTVGHTPHSKVLFLSAGSGVTPMLSMSRWIRDRELPTDVVYFHTAKTPDDLMFHDEVEAMVGQGSFASKVSFTRLAPEHEWSGLRGHIDLEMLQSLAPDLAERRVFVCGPEAFMDKVADLLASINFPKHRFHRESFGGPDLVDAAGGTVVFTKSERTVKAGGQQSLLDTAALAGVQIGSACRTGDCGECKVRVSGAAPSATTAALAPYEIEDGYVLSCVAFANGEVKVEA